MPNLVVEFLDRRPVPRRRRRYSSDPPQSLSSLPSEWRDVLVRWVRRGGNSRWETLKKDAGVSRQQAADSLLDWMLRHGWVVVDEERKLGDWWPLRVELRDLATLRTALGLADVADLVSRRDALMVQLEAQGDPALETVLDTLESMPAGRALERAVLVLALLDWRAQGRSGTRRDFALFARKDTKDITDAEWRWLDENLDLVAFGVGQHTPLFLVAAPLQLELANGTIDLGACPDFAVLTPATLAAARSAQGRVVAWMLVENRTSFERVVRTRSHDEGVIWLPGYPPSWWRQMVTRLLELSPAPARVACDPDPAGIAIALMAGGLWQDSGLSWEPWKMSADELVALPKHKRLSERDLTHLHELLQGNLPQMLLDLALVMLKSGEKGEQEGYL